MRLRIRVIHAVPCVDRLRFASRFPAIETILQRVTLLLCAACFSCCLSEAQTAPLTLAQCIELAEKAPSTVKEAHQRLLAARRTQSSVAAAFLPQVNIVNGFTYNSPLLYDRSVFSFVALNGIREYMTVANASWEADTSGRIKAEYDRARASRREQEANEAIAARDLRADVAAAYYRLLLTRKLADAADENARVAGDFRAKVKKLLDAEEASRADESRAAAEAASLQRTAAITRTAAANANHELASFWTEDVGAEVAIVDDLEQQFAAPASVAGDQGFLKRPEFSVAQAQIDLHRAESHIARAALLPQLRMNFEYGFDTNQLVSQNRGYAGFAHFDIPVFDFFHTLNQKRALDEQTRAAETGAAVLRRQMSRAYQDALSQANGTYASLAPTEEGFHAAEESVRLSRERFGAGEGSALDVVTAEKAFVQAQIDFYSTRADYLNAQSALKVASGQ